MNGDHFKGKTALEHVNAVRSQIVVQESHAVDPKKSVFAGLDAARETAALFLLIIVFLPFAFHSPLLLLSLFLFGWVAWKMGRTAWLAWSHLERLHRLLEEERFEIEHNRLQEREELKALYADKGFQGELLEEVVDVLMADSNRLLKVMVEEELGLPLESYEHPLVQSMGAGLGSLLPGVFMILAFAWGGVLGGAFMAFLISLIGAALSARMDQNRLIPALVWNVAITALPAGSVYFLLNFFNELGWIHG